MSHSFTKIWIHSVFSTKDRMNLIIADIEKDLYAHIKEEIKLKFECNVRAINGMPDHVHILFLLNPNHSIKDILQNIKGESSHWVNHDNLTKGKFSWQTGYSAFSVSESKVNDVEKYINNQKEHHKKMTFQEEYDLFMKKYGSNIVNR